MIEGDVTFQILLEDWRCVLRKDSTECLVANALNRHLGLKERGLYAAVGLGTVGIHKANFHDTVATAVPDDALYDAVVRFDAWELEPKDVKDVSYTLTFRRHGA